MKYFLNNFEMPKIYTLIHSIVNKLAAVAYPFPDSPFLSNFWSSDGLIHDLAHAKPLPN